MADINRNAGEGFGDVPQARVPKPLEESTLPTWDVIDIGGSFITITCPRCEGTADVDPVKWRENPFPTRPCTYCFKTSRLPGRI